MTEFSTVAELGGTIADRRRELGLTQAQLAERIGVSRQWLVAFERGKPTIEAGLALRTLRALSLHLVLTLDNDSTAVPIAPGRRGL